MTNLSEPDSIFVSLFFFYLFPTAAHVHRRSLTFTEYDYQHAMAQHAAALSGHNNQLHPAMAQIPMLQAAGLNLTVSTHAPTLLHNTHIYERKTGQTIAAGHFARGLVSKEKNRMPRVDSAEREAGRRSREKELPCKRWIRIDHVRQFCDLNQSAAGFNDLTGCKLSVPV